MLTEGVPSLVDNIILPNNYVSINKSPIQGHLGGYALKKKLCPVISPYHYDC